MYTEDDLLPISSLQHLAFCERQVALIHIEGQWQENVLTVEGEALHEQVHAQETGTIHDIRTVRGLRIRSLRLGLIGVADVVEFRQVGSPNEGVPVLTVGPGLWQPYIIEYKRGKPKLDRSDEVQLCAQAICLEEMLGAPIQESAFFYGMPRRRQVVSLDNMLRQETEKAAERVHQLLLSGKTPAPAYSPKCRNCSLIDQCLPKTTSSSRRVARYLKKMTENGDEG
jgi:CRISPR-associated exonuclease Cas4